jgi:hypothetical protein
MYQMLCWREGGRDNPSSSTNCSSDDINKAGRVDKAEQSGRGRWFFPIY